MLHSLVCCEQTNLFA